MKIKLTETCTGFIKARAKIFFPLIPFILKRKNAGVLPYCPYAVQYMPLKTAYSFQTHKTFQKYLCILNVCTILLYSVQCTVYISVCVVHSTLIQIYSKGLL